MSNELTLNLVYSSIFLNFARNSGRNPLLFKYIKFYFMHGITFHPLLEITQSLL